MKFVLLIFAVYVTADTQAQFFQYFYTAPAQQAFTPVLQPPQIQHPQFYYQPAQPQYLPPSNPVYRQPEPEPVDNYLGFSYHTNYDDGASSTVVFFRGAVANTTKFNRGITVASDSLDPQRTRDVEQRLQNVLNGRAAKNLAPTPAPFVSFSPLFSAILDNPQTGTFHYYQNDGLPASTSLLKPIETNTNYDSGAVESVRANNSTDFTSRNFDIEQRIGFAETTRPPFPTIATAEIASVTEPVFTTTERSFAEEINGLESLSGEKVIENSDISSVEPLPENIITSTEKATEPLTEKPAEPSTEKLLEPSTEKEESFTSKITEPSTEKLLEPSPEDEEEPSAPKVIDLATEKASETSDSSQSSSEEQRTTESSNESSSTEDISGSESMSVEKVLPTVKVTFISNTIYDKDEDSNNNSTEEVITEKLAVELTTEHDGDATTTETETTNTTESS